MIIICLKNSTSFA